MSHNQTSHSHKKDAKSSIYTYVWWLAGLRVTLHTLYFLRMVPQWVTSTFRPDERRRSNLHHYTDTTGQFTAQHKTNIGLRVFSTIVYITYQSKFQNIIYVKIRGNFQTACIQKNIIVTYTSLCFYPAFVCYPKMCIKICEWKLTTDISHYFMFLQSAFI